MSEAIAEIKRMHDAYVRGTGLNIALDMKREMDWYRAYERGIRAEGIVMVIDWMKQRMRKQLAVRSFNFRTFVGNVDFLEEDIAAAQSEARIRRPHVNRASVLQATGRPPAAEPPPSRSAGEIVASSTFLSKLEEFKKQEGL